MSPAKPGVGTATVSRALALEPHPDVSEATRERIREVADRLGYRPSMATRALRAGDRQVISVILPDTYWGWLQESLRAAFKRENTLGYQLVAHPTTGIEGMAQVIES